MLVCWQAQKCVKLKCMCVSISQGTSTGHNYSSELLAAVTIGYNLSEPLFALVFLASNHICSVKRALSDSTGVLTFIKNLKLAYLLCLPFFLSYVLPVCGDIHNASSHGECVLILMIL